MLTSTALAERLIAGLRLAAAAIAAALVALSVAGCSGGGVGPDLVIVRIDTGPYNLDAAQRAADQQCAGRGAGPAQYILLVNNARSAGGQNGGGSSGPPEILYRCGRPARD